jgi:hypothetical protein
MEAVLSHLHRCFNDGDEFLTAILRDGGCTRRQIAYIRPPKYLMFFSIRAMYNCRSRIKSVI